MPFEGSHCPSCRGALGPEKQRSKQKLMKSKSPRNHMILRALVMLRRIYPTFQPVPGCDSGFCECYNVTGVEKNRSLGRLFFDFVLKEWLEVGIDLANAHIPCLIVLNQLEVDAAEGQNTDNVQHCRYCAEKVGDLPDKAGRKAIAYCVKNSQQAGNRVQVQRSESSHVEAGTKKERTGSR